MLSPALGLEFWLEATADPTIQQKREIKKQEETQKLLQLYLQRQLEFFASQIWLRQVLAQAQLGAIFFYPEAEREHDQKNLEFLRYKDLEESLDISMRLALPHIEKHNPVTEIVVCVCMIDGYNICGVLLKSFLKRY